MSTNRTWTSTAFSLSIFLVAMGACVGTGSADPTITDTKVPAFASLVESEGIEFSTLPPVESAVVESLLMNGQVVDPRLFPAIFRMTTGGTCTAAAVGPAVILTASHCVPDNSLIQFQITATEGSVRGVCQRSPSYDTFYHSDDWALCLLEHEIDGMTFETIDIQSLPQPDDIVFLTGYGCTKRGVDLDGDLDGDLRIGPAKVVARQPFMRVEPSAIYTDGAAFAGQDGTILCPGDSGGPLFVFFGDLGDSRRIVGVNSRTDYRYSYFSATGSTAGRSFIEYWANLHGQEICGVNRSEQCK
jgi:hypothetical protein